ncbi:16S rRNA (uracil(1498)-N(3))-methyltransferase [Campylobacter vulpis]|uniref:Ribosomal RNA small subunit methyltransferase E n=1 Tax=Campylobacter vulpis TaxID=1655500 RepID=A0A2G4R6G9_9BACT|nr:16S rRNA (uracil(1498)-N(3))-methyltransferase [Campylobacter vulpis]MBS4235370.1 16S rRNA (uracil(1498)-N(3))-methyltransferase [Campylobacter vulpis]MBS4240148.1 16S rRNA (uracil(1498)-N(3))-methyltransferase [Campylobacter vulpis]MBS4252925.1 16S rRNA (uracil(1498)-N(3))-methyltransferase [Campylobacter vulpis]MBS4268709.1 16S rRNA (uracil(1498)-N(3))-methyltransferase [Campylobacter vulpis]MBS4275472.1 16S rRNA (uracil(1498)-N(3))-methyltransferase [Campylobacter vulpis]
MQFLYHKEAKNPCIFLEKEAFLHLKVRRVKEGESLNLRNFQDDFLYTYKISDVKRNSCVLNLSSQKEILTFKSGVSLALGVIEPKILEKILPFFNEMGLQKLILVYCEFSQKNFKIDKKRLEKILINSCQQCGRGDLMELELYENVDHFLTIYPKVVLVDFEGEKKEFDKDTLYFIGAEGGFSQSEKRKIKDKIALNSPFILKSQSAALGVLSKILL